MTRLRTASALSALVLSAAVLTGCSASGEAAPGEQSVSDACAIASRAIAGVGADMQAVAATAAADPGSLIPVYEEASATITATAEGLGNEEVTSALVAAAKALDTLTIAYAEYIADPENADLVAFDDALDGIDADFSAIDALCAS